MCEGICVCVLRVCLPVCLFACWRAFMSVCRCGPAVCAPMQTGCILSQGAFKIVTVGEGTAHKEFCFLQRPHLLWITRGVLVLVSSHKIGFKTVFRGIRFPPHSPNLLQMKCHFLILPLICASKAPILIFFKWNLSDPAAGLLLISAYKAVCGLQDGKCRLRLPSCGRKSEVQQDISALTGEYRRHWLITVTWRLIMCVQARGNFLKDELTLKKWKD